MVILFIAGIFAICVFLLDMDIFVAFLVTFVVVATVNVGIGAGKKAVAKKVVTEVVDKTTDEIKERVRKIKENDDLIDEIRDQVKQFTEDARRIAERTGVMAEDNKPRPETEPRFIQEPTTDMDGTEVETEEEETVNFDSNW